MAMIELHSTRKAKMWKKKKKNSFGWMDIIFAVFFSSPFCIVHWIAVDTQQKAREAHTIMDGFITARTSPWLVVYTLKNQFIKISFQVHTKEGRRRLVWCLFRMAPTLSTILSVNLTPIGVHQRSIDPHKKSVYINNNGPRPVKELTRRASHSQPFFSYNKREELAALFFCSAMEQEHQKRGELIVPCYCWDE